MNTINDTEQASILWKDIIMKEAELRKTKKEYQKLYKGIVKQWKTEITNRFPGLKIKSVSTDGDVVIEIAKDSIHYQIELGKNRNKLICIILLSAEDFQNGIRMSNEFMADFKGIMSYQRGNYAMFSEFNMTEFDEAFLCCINAIKNCVNESFAR